MVGDLLAQFPTVRADMSDGFVGALASVLMAYPRQVVLKITNPLSGLASEIKFISISDVVAWCERHTKPLREDRTREKRIAEQLAARDEWQRAERSQGLMEKLTAWLDRTDPQAKAMLRDSDESDAKRRAKNLEYVEMANRRFFRRMCAYEGVDPAMGASPALLKTLVREPI